MVVCTGTAVVRKDIQSPCCDTVCVWVKPAGVSDPRLGPSLKGEKVSCEGVMGPRSQLDRRTDRRSGD